MSELKLNLSDTETAFSNVTTKELKQKIRLFKSMRPITVWFLSLGGVQKLTLLSLRIPIIRILSKKFIKPIFKQFVGGESIEECDLVISELAKFRVGTILDYAAEAKKDEKVFEDTKEEILCTIDRAKDNKWLPFSVFKVTGIASVKLLEKVSMNQNLTESEQLAWANALTRVNTICNFAYSLKQPVLIDAEESWIQNAIDKLAEEAMEKYNCEKPFIFNTIQLYRHDRFEFLKESYQKAKVGKYILAVKLVRGAYMEKERERAKKMKYLSPIQENKPATHKSYNAALEYCLENIEDIALFAGTHNKESIKLIVKTLNERNISPDHPHLFIGQLYGMGNNLSYVLAKNNFSVSKYLPYGLVEDLIPYLTRRAYENKSFSGEMNRELKLMVREIQRRKQNNL